MRETIYDIFEKAGYECPSIKENSRKLIFENPQKQVRYFWVKPSDVAIYVERGAADIGVAGKDIVQDYMSPKVFTTTPGTSLGDACKIMVRNSLRRIPIVGGEADISKAAKKLLGILNKIVDHGDTRIVIEHNLDVIKVADYIIDLGPDGGSNGGTVVALGTPEEVSRVENSYTGQFLKKYSRRTYVNTL